MFHRHVYSPLRFAFEPPHRRWFGCFGHQAHRGGEGDWEWPPFGPFGRHWRRPRRGSERLFEKGDLKYVILDLLRDQPRHGYDIIRALEERFRGMYSPSPGSVYPTLQLLEDQGYVTSTQRDGKKVYTITDEGRRFLDAQRETLDAIRARMEGNRGSDAHAELRALMGELAELGRTVFRHASRRALEDPEKVRRLRAIVTRARGEIEAVLGGEPSPPPVL